MKKTDLVGFAHSFVSFALPRFTGPIQEIILFGSVARGDFTSKSDIDLFFSVSSSEQAATIEQELKVIEPKFYKSQMYQLWKQKGAINPLSIKVGVLEQWELKRSIISDGIVLYGKYKSEVKGKGYVLIPFTAIPDITKRNRIMRTLFGRVEEGYSKEGLVTKLGGRRIAPTVFFIPLQFADQVIPLLKKEKMNYELIELWTDQL